MNGAGEGEAADGGSRYNVIVMNQEIAFNPGSLRWLSLVVPTINNHQIYSHRVDRMTFTNVELCAASLQP